MMSVPSDEEEDEEEELELKKPYLYWHGSMSYREKNLK